MTRPAKVSVLVREALLGNPKGLTLKQLSELVGKSQDLVSSTLYRTYGFYISDWVLNENGNIGMIAVWSCVVVPASLPKPMVTEDMKAYQREYRKKNAARLEAARKKRIAEMREIAKIANAKMRAEREEKKKAEARERFKAKVERETLRMQEKLERKRKREKPNKVTELIDLTPAAPAGYVPEKTRWVPVQPWRH